MGKLLALVSGNPMVLLWVLLGAFGLGLTTGGVGAWKFQGARLDTVKAEFAGFVGQVKILGEAAGKAATEQTARDKAAKLKADDENTLALDKLRADNKRLRSARASGSFVPAAATGASRPDLACFVRPELESALRTLDTEVQGLIEIGDEATVNLDTAKRWAGAQATSK